MNENDTDTQVAKKIRATEKSHDPYEGKLETDDAVLARITEGIYRQPGSALRELISNAYDADATEVIIMTDAPRFSQITVRDNGTGMTPETLTHLVKHIGGSAKRNEDGKELNITSQKDFNKSPGGRQLIGKMGIGLFSVAQFTRHFLIISKTADDNFRTVADITLRRQIEEPSKTKHAGQKKFETGHFSIWREPASDKGTHGTEIKLLDLLPRTRDELASEDTWLKQDFINSDPEAEHVDPPEIHIGRMEKGTDGVIKVPSKLPWEDKDSAKERFGKLVQKLRELVSTDRESIDLRKSLDNYMWTLWTLSLSVPVRYLEEHPFDLKYDGEIRFYELQNKTKGQATPLKLSKGKSPRDELNLKTPNGVTGKKFDVFMDGVQLFRPILFTDLPKTKNAVTTPLMFIGNCKETFATKPVELTDGPIEFEAYLFWAPKIIPKQHQGVILRVGNASGALFDTDFMGYETSELTRKSQVTAEIFIGKGLDNAINIDRESFNYAHPHYQFLTKWLHSAFRQFSNRHKELGKELRANRIISTGDQVTESVSNKVKAALKMRGIEDVPEVIFSDSTSKTELAKLRRGGSVVISKSVALPNQSRSNSPQEITRRKMQEQKAKAIAQLLHGMGLMESLSFDEQDKLIRDILNILLED
jgi:Histidine kinase-, DNA gyrase B-, and HSP90-like ATPase